MRIPQRAGRGRVEIQITHVELLVNVEAAPVKRCRTGDTIKLRMHCSAAKAIPELVVAFAIEALGEATVTAPCSRDAGLAPASISGTGFIDVDMNDVSLLPGTYDLHTAVTDFSRAHVYDTLHLASRFDVMNGRPYEVGGVMTMRFAWTMS